MDVLSIIVRVYPSRTAYKVTARITAVGIQNPIRNMTRRQEKRSYALTHVYLTICAWNVLLNGRYPRRFDNGIYGHLHPLRKVAVGMWIYTETDRGQAERLA